LAVGCQKPYAGTDLTISKAAPFYILPGTNIQPNVASKVCVSCKNKDHTITHDNFSVTQTGKCFNSLTVNKFQPTTIDWSSSTDMVTLADPVKDIFTNEYSDGCPLTQCSLMTKGCSEEYTGKDISMSKVAPFTISTVRNVFEGVNKQVCVKCSSKGQSITADNIQVTQT